jgi:hypothetical protein
MRITSDKRIIIASAFGVTLALCLLLFNFSLSLKKERERLRAEQRELMALRDEYTALKASLDTVEGRKSVTKVEGIVQAVDEVFRSMGLNQKVKSVKPTGSRDRKFAVEEEAEVQVERVDMNEMVNILYKLENAPMVLSVRKTTIKTSFDNPSLLNITMTISLIKPR